MRINIRRAFTLIQIILVIIIIALGLTVYLGTRSSPPANPPSQTKTGQIKPIEPPILLSEKGLSRSSIVVQTTGNDQVRIESGINDIVKIDGKPCLVTVFMAKGEGDNRVQVWFLESEHPEPVVWGNDFAKQTIGKAVIPIDKETDDYKRLDARKAK